MRSIDESYDETVQALVQEAQARGELGALPGIPIVFPFPLLHSVSGVYEWKQTFPFPVPTPHLPPVPHIPPAPGGAEADDAGTAGAGLFLPFKREVLRLDVDGRYPQLTASGTLYAGLMLRVHWIANLTKTSANHWSGSIWFKDGTASALPSTKVQIQTSPSWFPALRKATVTFSGGGAPSRTVTYKFASVAFHPVQFEFDSVAGTTAVTSIETHDHPNRPATLPSETLTIEKVYQRAGFAVTKAGGDSTIPIAAAGANARWSDAEMHDAMQVHWSKFADKAQWSMWALFASLHDQGTSLGGIMFDDIGPNHRQGTAIFNDAFISTAPPGEANPVAWVKRMRFWTACHEMGHAFNLAHSWQKSHPPAWGTPWIPLANEPEARSFMNYPYGVAGGETAFFADFPFRFSDPELLFMRHAPERFVQMGNADWFDHHGFEQAEVAAVPPLRLETRVNRPKPEFEFLEPVVIELKLTNTSDTVRLVDDDLLHGDHETIVILKREGRPARRWAPFARYCQQHQPVVLKPGESMYASMFVSAGLNGWDLAEPGRYLVQVSVRYGESDIVSPPLRLKIAPPRGFEEDRIAQDFFSSDVGRVLAFDGTMVLTSANDTLQEVVAQFSDRRVAQHAGIALALPGLRHYKELDLDAKKQGFKVTKPQPKAREHIERLLVTQASEAAETLGHIDYRYYADRYSALVSEQGDNPAAAKCQKALHKALSARKVLPRVLAEIEESQARYQSGK